jgi:hypothetical protein
MLMQQNMAGAIPVTPEARPRGRAEVATQTNDVSGRPARIPDHARAPDYGTTYLWLDAGQSWPFLRSFEALSNGALCVWLVVAAACCCWAMIYGDRRHATEEATVQMERLAEKLESTTAMPTPASNAVARVIGQPWYDCRHVACSAQLTERNHTARENLLARKPRAAAADVKP